MAAPIEERFLEIDGIRVLLRGRPGEGPPVVFVHGNPTSSLDWVPFLERLPGPAVAFDLPGFGRSERPRPDRFDHSLGAYAGFVAELLAELAPDGYSLVVHDWGSVALVAAQRDPGRVRRLVVIDAVPLSGAYRWHWIARIWRRRGLGEAFNRATSRFAVAQLLRLARPGLRPMPEPMIDAIWEGWDAGTRRAVLALYRSADPDVLEAAGGRLGELHGPALVVWGEGDPYISAADGRVFERRLSDVRFRLVERAGHWPWIDRPELIGEVNRFLAGG
ncbi:MAG: alpha/beta hydrolase [Solirubrobacterales bacterium]